VHGLPAAILVLTLCCASGSARTAMSLDPFSNPDLAPLAVAVMRGDTLEIRRHAERIHPDTPGTDGATLLVAAIGANQADSVHALLELGADPNRPGGGGETPVHAAAFAANPALLRAVLEHGGNPCLANAHTGSTPLMQAILGQNPEQIAILLDAGADPRATDFKHDTALHIAGRTNAGATILLLLERGANPLAKNAGGATFQDYYFAFNRRVLSDRAKAERRQIVAWLKAHDIPLGALVQAVD